MGLLRRRKSASADFDDHLGAPAVVGGIPYDAPPPVTDPDEQLRRLEDLRDRGILSDEEFVDQKLRVLGL